MTASPRSHRPLARASLCITRLSVMLLTALSLSGCNYIILAGYLIGGPPSIEPDFDAMTSLSMTDKDTKVLVFCYAPSELKWDNARIDYDLAKHVTYRLAQHHVKAYQPDLVYAWLDKNPDWNKPEEIGAAFEATYVIYIDLHKYSLYENNSQYLYRGRAEGLVSVFQMDEDGNGEKIYTKEIISKFPLQAPRSTSEVTYSTFKQQYLARLSEEIGRLFYEYYAGDDIPDAT